MKSLWSATCKIPVRKELNQNIQTDAVIIGGGMAGILTAYMLQKSGLKTVVLEAGRIGSGMTQNTTAKITSQHNLIYTDLLRQFGQEITAMYAAANQAAIDEYQALIIDEQINCHFERRPSYVYTLDNAGRLEKETSAAEKCGIPAEFTTSVTLPFPVRGAVKFSNQAQFHPLEFLSVLSKKLQIYENTKAFEIEEKTVRTENHSVTADFIILACHFPFVNVPGYYFARMYQQRSYVLALSGVPQLDGMYIGADEKGYSFRSYENFILLGGSGHRTGQNQNGGSYENLKNAAASFYPASTLMYQWSAQDCIPLDGIPYIGQFSSKTPNLFVATGFQKWGMSSSMAAARLISDLISKRDSPFKEVFTPQRFKISASVQKLAENSGKSVKGLFKGFFSIPDEQLNQIPKGHGGVVEYEGEKVGIYKDENGEIFMVSVRCPHLGCELAWNPDELSWDCPCHGSRFDYKGNLLNGPAMENLNTL